MIEINNVSFSYKRTPVFRNINLRFEKGCVYGLLGENGVGKTTLLKIICGLQLPQQGDCKVDGMKAFDRLPQMLQNIFFLPDEVQLPDNATPAKYMRDLMPFYPQASEETFLRLMAELEVEPQRKFKEMSFGQQKKSLIACALSLGTDYVLLDEPTNGLDIPSKAHFRRILADMAAAQRTILISTHQVKDVENLIDPIVILSNDAVLLNADVKTITEKLYFEYDGAQNSEALYSELSPRGYLNVLPNRMGVESEVNIEALFNAVLQNSERVKELFRQ